MSPIRMTLNFYPRPPRGGRPRAASTAVRASGFLSTPSARRATQYTKSGLSKGGISIHALREEGDIIRRASIDPDIAISIHALREEGDCGCC